MEVVIYHPHRVVMKMKIIVESVRVALAYYEHYVSDAFTCYQVVNFVDLLKYYAYNYCKVASQKTHVEYKLQT